MRSTHVSEAAGYIRADRRDKIWSEEDIASLLSIAPKEIQLALMLAIWTGQRQGDLLRLPWSAYDGTHIRLQQSKDRPAHRDARRRAAEGPAGRYRTPRPADPDQYAGPPMDRRTGFRTSWGKLSDRAGIGDLTFHDLRGHGRCAPCDRRRHGAADRDVHRPQPKDVEAILDAHYLGRDIQLAEAAVLKLEARTKL